MNLYTPFPGEQTLTPPGTFTDTRFFYFFLRADPDRLQACCDKYFNDRLEASGADLRYRSLGYVMLAFSHVEELASADAAAGKIRYKDIAFWVPTLAKQTGALPRLCLFPPAIFVDEGSTMVSGREMFGLPKQLGRFEMPLAPEEMPATAPPQFRLEVHGTLQPGGTRDWRTLLTISARRDVGRPGPIARALRTVSELTGVLEIPSIFEGLSLPDALTTTRSLGLKQFRDAERIEQSCYTAIVEAPLSTERLIDDPQFFHDDFDLTLESPPVPSHPIAAELGLRAGTQRVKAALFFRAHMRMEAGKVVWRQP